MNVGNELALRTRVSSSQDYIFTENNKPLKREFDQKGEFFRKIGKKDFPIILKYSCRYVILCGQRE